MFAPCPAAVLRNALRLLVPLSVVLTAYIYLYPVFGQCAFPLPPTGHRPIPYADAQSSDALSDNDPAAAFVKTLGLHMPPSLNKSLGHSLSHRYGLASRPFAPFRLLALGDPQLEGDSSIPNAYRDSSFPHLVHALKLAAFQKTTSNTDDSEDSSSENLSLSERIRQELHDVIDFWFLDIPNTIESVRKRIDLFGNDLYLAHIVRMTRWWTAPTHVSVLGDLLGSQWIDDDEFDRRADRFWDRLFAGSGERVPDDIALYPSNEYDLSGYLVGTDPATKNETNDIWARRIINVAGNHDIGYAGDINYERVARFERTFGKANYELRFELPADRLSPDARAAAFDETTNPESNLLIPELRIVNINDMNLDTPAQSTELQDQTYKFINDVINTGSAVELKGHFTLVLTHIPLYKPEGICVDAPFFSFHEEDDTLKEQNLLSEDASDGFLQGIFGMHGDRGAPGGGRGRQGLVMNGHDHEGCDTYHFINQSDAVPVEDRKWEKVRWSAAKEAGLLSQANKDQDGLPGVREITVRSMMGDFGGNAGLLSAWFDEHSWEWRFEYATCAIGRQHMWWVAHILDLITVFVSLVFGIVAAVEAITGRALPWPSKPSFPAKRTSAPAAKVTTPATPLKTEESANGATKATKL
ncbi:polarized growth protein [Ophiostoma piceae UAMH 11346]|uniref:Polarized growth protein n=1 Tax=Ophiostoma piceae (strain UAMH 11346) TaxID=1262450 RepID=S3C8K3_OPHP1|nr:polarized growth protein [Ophiostoma piceae UAMH 11346]